MPSDYARLMEELRETDLYREIEAVIDAAVGILYRNEDPMPLLTRETILAASTLPTEEVDVSEWVEGGSVLVRCLTGAERGQLELDGQRIQKGDETTLPRLRAKVAVWCCVDETGKRLFEAKDIEALAAKHPAPLDRIFTAVRKLSGLDEDGKKRASKRSSSQSDDSGTDSPSPSEA